MPLVMRSRASASLLEFPCRSSQKIGLLAGPCWERLSPVRGRRRRFGTEIIAKSKAHTKRDAGPLKRIPPEPQLEQQKDPPRNPTTHPNLMFHYQCFWPPNRWWGISPRFGVSKNVEDCRTHYGIAEIC